MGLSGQNSVWGYTYVIFSNFLVKIESDKEKDEQKKDLRQKQKENLPWA